MIPPRIAAALAVAAVSACSPAIRPPLLALALGERACDAAPVISRAIPVPFDSLAGATVVLDERSACVQPPDRSVPATTYAVFALPSSGIPTALTFESLYAYGNVSKPIVSLLDANGRTLRTLSDTEYEHLGTGLRAGMRLGPREAYLVAVSDPAAAGQPLRLRYGSARYQRYASNAPIVIYTPPPDVLIPANVVPATYALNGSFHVYALPVPVVK